MENLKSYELVVINGIVQFSEVLECLEKSTLKMYDLVSNFATLCRKVAPQECLVSLAAHLVEQVFRIMFWLDHNSKAPNQHYVVLTLADDLYFWKIFVICD